MLNPQSTIVSKSKNSALLKRTKPYPLLLAAAPSRRRRPPLAGAATSQCCYSLPLGAPPPQVSFFPYSSSAISLLFLLFLFCFFYL